MDESRKCRVDIAAAAGAEDFDLLPNCRRRRLHVFDERISAFVGIEENCKTPGSRQQLVQKPEPLAPKLEIHGADTGNVAAWPVEALDKAELHRIGAEHEDDWYRRGGGLCRAR